MPDHVTTQLRNAIKAALETIPGFESGRVFISREWKFNSDELHAINIMSGPEMLKIEAAKMAQPNLQRRRVQNFIMIIDKATDDLDNVLDAVKLPVENKILSTPRFGGLCLNTHLERVEISAVPGMETEFGVMIMGFVSEVMTREGTAETAIGG